MEKNEPAQNLTLLNKDCGNLESIILKYSRMIKITRLLIYCAVILLIVSFFFGININMHNFKSVPINYERLTEDSVEGNYYYIDSIISCSEAFSILNTSTVNDVKFNSNISTYYFAEDKNGFEFFIYANSSTKDYLENSMKNGYEQLILYGTLTTLPTDIESIPASAINDIPEYARESLSNKTDDFISYVNQHKILHVFSNPQKEKSVIDGINPMYKLLMILRILLVVTFIVLLILKKHYTIKYMNASK